MHAIAIILVVIAGFLAGALSLLGYMVWRMMKNDGWDDSNINNALRLLSHVVLHPNDFGKMYYLSQTQVMQLRQLSTAYEDNFPVRPFWYVELDELSEVVQSRPEG